ncbi:putative membrane protein [Allomuricauda ruestringensis DSM 13258]|uniref:Membrane protein n=1 Tax=Allomuricauda ruestringensis (strain DSM 13258 / CIP 107369 / LMG 19739 / B1) TaxID=886377 RepID=G2PN22_ALLRU|nr:type IX secretion system membrane protein PorP/SprF [Allomuricauda ruestringensis]AEM72370.1 putative membrane protein [Allomuricauda ruestringensis DSM 13258]
MKKFILLMVVVVVCHHHAIAQQAPQFTQYLYNPVSINPAFAGSTKGFSAILMHRSQWSGFEGAPSTQMFSAHTPLRNEKVGLGLSLVSDALGEEKFDYLYGDFSYTLQVGRTTRLAFGIKAGFTHYSLSPELLNRPDVQSDPYFNYYSDSWSPNVGVGSFLYGKRWYVAVSVPQMFNVDYIVDTDTSFRVSDRPNLYVTAGYDFPLANSITLKPRSMVILTDAAPVSIDAGANVSFHDRFMIGANYRFNSYDAVGGLGSFMIGKKLMLGYAYEVPVSGIRPYTGGTHEFFLRYDFISNIN